MSASGADSTQRQRVTLFLGVHADVVQLASVYESLMSYAEMDVRVVVTGEDEAGVARGVEAFAIGVDQAFSISCSRFDRDRFSDTLLDLLEVEFREYPPAIVVVVGHSTSAFCVALACYQQEIGIAHVGAGVRGTRGGTPSRDEVNCVMVDAVARVNFIASVRAEENLLDEGVDPAGIMRFGDPADDSLAVLCSRIEQAGPESSGLRKLAETSQRWIVATCDPRLEDADASDVMLESLRHLAIRYHDVASIVMPLPMDSSERELLSAALQGFSNVHLVAGLGHVDYVWLAHRGAVFITDGGIGQKLAMHRPTSVLRQLLVGVDFQTSEAASFADLEQSSIVAGVVALFEGEVLRNLRRGTRGNTPQQSAGSRIAECVVQTLRGAAQPA